MTSEEMPIIVKDGRGAGTLRTTRAIGNDYQQRIERLLGLGYLCVHGRSSRTGRTQSSTWLAPNRGWEGIEAWANEMGALLVREKPATIVVREGAAGRFVGRGGKTIKEVAAHCGHSGFIGFVEARKVGGTRVVVTSRNDGTVVLAAHRHGGEYDFDCWWEFEGRIIGHEENNSCRKKPPEFEGLPTRSLRKEEVEALERGEHPFRMSLWERDKVGVSSDDLELVWLVMKDLPGYEEARAQL